MNIVKRDRETGDRETVRQRDREAERQRDRETERQRDRETERQRFAQQYLDCVQRMNKFSG